MNTPPRFFAAPPPSAPRRRFSLALGAVLISTWVAVVVVVRLLHWPIAVVKSAVWVAALLWLFHVVGVVLHNRALDRGSMR